MDDNRVVISMRVRPETKRKVEQWKRNNPDAHWDSLLDAALKGINVARKKGWIPEILDHETP